MKFSLGLFLAVLGIAAVGCVDSEASSEDADMDASEIGTKAPPIGVTWRELSMPRGGLDGQVTVDDVAFLQRIDGTPVTRDGGKPTLFVIERLGMKSLPFGGGAPAFTDPGVALLLRSDDGGATFRELAQLPGLG